MSLIEIVLLIFLIGFFIIFGIGVFRKKRMKGYLKIGKFFEGGFESDD